MTIWLKSYKSKSLESLKSHTLRIQIKTNKSQSNCKALRNNFKIHTIKLTSTNKQSVFWKRNNSHQVNKIK